MTAGKVQEGSAGRIGDAREQQRHEPDQHGARADGNPAAKHRPAQPMVSGEGARPPFIESVHAEGFTGRLATV